MIYLWLIIGLLYFSGAAGAYKLLYQYLQEDIYFIKSYARTKFFFLVILWPFWPVWKAIGF